MIKIYTLLQGRIHDELIPSEYLLLIFTALLLKHLDKYILKTRLTRFVTVDDKCLIELVKCSH